MEPEPKGARHVLVPCGVLGRVVELDQGSPGVGVGLEDLDDAGELVDLASPVPHPGAVRPQEDAFVGELPQPVVVVEDPRGVGAGQVPDRLGDGEGRIHDAGGRGVEQAGTRLGEQQVHIADFVGGHAPGADLLAGLGQRDGAGEQLGDAVGREGCHRTDAPSSLGDAAAPGWWWVESSALGPEVARSVMSRAIRVALSPRHRQTASRAARGIGAGPARKPESASATSPAASHRVASP